MGFMPMQEEEATRIALHEEEFGAARRRRPDRHCTPHRRSANNGKLGCRKEPTPTPNCRSGSAMSPEDKPSNMLEPVALFALVQAAT